MEKSKRIKRIINSMTLLLAFVALVIASVGASFSFAWFSEHSTAEIQSVNFNSQAVTNIGFDDKGDGTGRGAYLGQTAFEAPLKEDDPLLKEPKLITGKETGKDPEFFLNKAYSFGVPIDITSNAQNINIVINEVIITLVDNTTVTVPVENVPYAFTWYLVKSTDAGTIYCPNPTDKTKGRTGTRTFTDVNQADLKTYNEYYVDVDSNITEGPYVLATPEQIADSGIQKYEISKVSFEENIKITAEGEEYLFYIVFSPEKLYWNQFIVNENNVMTGNLDILTLYDATQRNKILYNNDNATTSTSNRLFYSNSLYMGCSFKFNVTMGTVNTNA